MREVPDVGMGGGGVYDPLPLAICTIIEGMKTIASLGFYLIILELDSLTVMRLLKSKKGKFNYCQVACGVNF